MTTTPQPGYLSPSALQIENHVVVLPCGGFTDKEPLTWSEHDVAKYVSYYSNGVPIDRMFGGVIFSAISSGSDRFLHPLYIGFGDASNKDDWTAWIELLFSPNVNLQALFQSVKRNNGLPIDVWVSLPYPHPTQENFGDVDGSILNFESEDDRYSALTWWMNEFIKRWEIEEDLHEGLTFRGFLWQREAIDENDEHVVRRTNAHAKKLGLYSIWLPNYRSYGYAKCNELGFDVTGLNPNYYGNTPCDYQWIHHTNKFASIYGTGLQITFGKGLVYSEHHLLDYLNLNLVNKSIRDCFFVYQFPNQTINDIYASQLIDYKRLYSFIKGTYKKTLYTGIEY